MTSRRRHPATRAIHPEADPVTGPSEPISPELVQTASFAFESMAAMDATIGGVDRGYAYSRVTNPTVDLFERTVADLEGAEEGLAQGSGMAAIHATLTTLLSSGDHIVVPRSLYGGTHALLTRMLPRFNVQVDFVDYDSIDNVAAAVRKNTKLIYAETITNPTLEVVDLEPLAGLAHEHDLPLVVDSTLATPALCRPIELGADLVIHSASKYLGGHGDLIAGVVVGSKSRLRSIRGTALLVGGACAPFVAWLALRGVKSLHARMRVHCDNAMAVARHLEKHPKVERVLYPGLSFHPSHDKATARFDGGYGAMVSLVLGGGMEEAERFCDRLEVFCRAGSLGDTHSLVLLPHMASHRSFRPEERRAAGIVDGFVRLSIGLEHAEDLTADIDQALDGL